MNLLELGLSTGDRVRFRRRPGGRWHEAVVRRRERDGSVGCSDEKGAARALPAERLEVAVAAPQGARRWEPVLARARRAEQLRLL